MNEPKETRARRQAIERWENEGGRAESPDEQWQPHRVNHSKRADKQQADKQQMQGGRVPRERRSRG